MIITRPLSCSEHFYRSRNASGFYKSFQVTGTYTNDITLDLLYKALRKTVLDYHLLVCNVVKKDDTYIYEPLREVILEDILVEVSEKKYLSHGVVNEEFMKYANEFKFNFLDNKPLFKLILIGKRNLCVVLEHTIADGLVGNYFHEILVENLSIMENKTEILEIGYGPFKNDGLKTVIFNYERDRNQIKNSLPPAVDDFLAKPQPTPANPVKSDYPRWPGRFPTTKDFTVAFKLINFDSEETKLLLTKCKQEGVTLTAYIEAVISYTLQPVYGKDHYTSNKIALALRRFMDPKLAPPEYRSILQDPNYKILGTSAHTGIAEIIEPFSEFSWCLVKRINSNLMEYLKVKNLMDSFFYFSDPALHVSNNEQFFEAQMIPARQDTLKLSNLGLINVPMYNTWTLSNMVFAQDISPPATDFMLNVISTKLGGLNLVLSYFDHHFEKGFENFDGLVADFRKNLLSFLNQSSHL